MMDDIWWLLIAYQCKHFLCDFPLQNEYMLGKFKPGLGFLLPLVSHCGVHAFGTFLISLIYLYQKESLATIPILLACTFDFVVHFIMDRIKAAPNLLGRFHALSATEYQDLVKFERDKGPDDQTEEDKRHNKYFWWALGLDQKVHHLTHYAIIYYLLHVVVIG